MDKIIDAVAHNKDPDCNELKRQHDLQLSVNSLSAIIQQQQDTINRLATQLNFVLSFLGIDNANFFYFIIQIVHNGTTY
jgi:hypothetical protein